MKSAFLAVILGAGLLAAPISTRAEEAQFSPEQTKAIENIVHDYLLKNPLILEDVLKALREKKEKIAMAGRKEVLKKLYKEQTPYSHGKGDVTIVEFTDYNCPYCKRAFNAIDEVVNGDKNVRVVYVEFPVLGPVSITAAKAALAAAKQGKYYEMHEALFSAPGRLTSDDQVFAVAKKAGLDIAKLKKDMEDPEIQKTIDDNLALGDDMGIQGTPAFFIGDAAIPGAPQNLADVLKQAVDATRKKGCSVC